MSHNLYFIALIAKVLTQDNAVGELIKAFTEIERLGHMPEYAIGYKQYRRFMREVAYHYSELGREAETAQFLEQILTTHTDAGLGFNEQARRDVFAGMEMHEILRLLYGHYAAALISLPGAAAVPTITVIREGIMIAEITPGMGALTRIMPGKYEIVLVTGLQLWEGELTASDLFLSASPQGRPVRLAAATGETVDRPTRQITMLDGDIVMNVFSGIDSGRIEVAF